MAGDRKIAVGMVLFEPDNILRFRECLNALMIQADKIYIFDNSVNKADIEFPESVVYKTEHENKGIAYALNQIFLMAEKDGYEWVITMDQDSVLPGGMIEKYGEVIDMGIQIGIVCPQVIDKRRAYMTVKKDPVYEYIDACITSASCTSVMAWKKIGGFDEWMFIDLVDNEFCKRLTVSGYKILRLNEFVLDQEFGKIMPKSYKKQQFWIWLSKCLHIENIAKFSYKKYVSPMRVYYTNRNIIYVNKKMKKYGYVGYECYNCKNYIGFIFSFMLPSIMRARQKLTVLRATARGIWDGCRKQVVLWEMNADSTKVI